MNIFFDFDGTLIDAKKRLYGLFKHLVSECDLSYEAYWDIKRRQLDHAHILSNNYNYTAEQIKQFTDVWMSEIETESWLNVDEPFAGMTEYLIELSKIADLYLITARQHPEMVVKQIANF